MPSAWLAGRDRGLAQQRRGGQRLERGEGEVEVVAGRSCSMALAVTVSPWLVVRVPVMSLMNERDL